MPPVTPRRTRRPSKGRLTPGAPRLLRAAARELVEHARVLGRDQHAEILVGRVLGDFAGSEDLHGCSCEWCTRAATVTTPDSRSPSRAGRSGPPPNGAALGAARASSLLRRRSRTRAAPPARDRR